MPYTYPKYPWDTLRKLALGYTIYIRLSTEQLIAAAPVALWQIVVFHKLYSGLMIAGIY